MKDTLEIRPATITDLPEMVALSRMKRLEYEQHQPLFWKYAGEKGDQSQLDWFAQLLGRSDYILLKAIAGDMLKGFIIGQLIQAPTVYAPGGLTLMVDDFCVSEPELWQTIGKELLTQIRNFAFERGAVQLVVVCGTHDEFKKAMLREAGYGSASEWFVQ